MEDLLDLHLAKMALDSANDGITISDMTLPDQPLIFINRAFENMTGYTNAEARGRNCRFLQAGLREYPQLEIIHQAIQHKKNCRVILKNFRKDGTPFWNELSLAPICDADNKLHYYVGIQKDITHAIMQKEQIVYLSEHDDLTGLYNYRGFFKRINGLIIHAAKENCLVGIGIADIDFFKQINDHYGHIKGNNILSLIGSQLLREFNSHDLIGRFGGDEFCFGLICKKNETEFFYKKILNVQNAVNEILSNNLHIGMSAGIVLENANENTQIDRLISRADTVMYNNKQFLHNSK